VVVGREGGVEARREDLDKPMNGSEHRVTGVPPVPLPVYPLEQANWRLES